MKVAAICLQGLIFTIVLVSQGNTSYIGPNNGPNCPSHYVKSSHSAVYLRLIKPIESKPWKEWGKMIACMFCHL